MNQKEFDAMNNKRRVRMLKDYLRTLDDDDVRRQVLKDCEREISDLGLKTRDIMPR